MFTTDKLWQEICADIKTSEATTSLEYAELFLNWLKKTFILVEKANLQNHLKVLDKYDIHSYLSLDLLEYNFQVNWLDFEEEVFIFLNYNPHNFDDVINKVISFLYKIIVYKSNVECPQCFHEELRIFTDHFKEIYYSCDNCYFLSDSKFNKIILRTDQKKEFLFVKKSELIKKKIIEE